LFYINGDYVEEKDAKIPATDLGIMRGFGVFDSLRTYRGKPFHLDDHLKKLESSASQIGLHLPKSITEIKEIILTLLRKSSYQESTIRTVITGGTGEKPTLMVFCTPFDLPQPRIEGIKTITTNLARCIPSSKTTEYIPAMVALQTSAHKEAKDALYLSSKQEILEATTSNFFAIKNGALITAFAGIYQGITRDILIRLAKSHFTIEPLPVKKLLRSFKSMSSSLDRAE
jgi:branched-chain amino acid aminotransferase